MKKLFSLMMILILLALPSGQALAESCPSPDQVTERIMALQETYPDHSLWSRQAFYIWEGVYGWGGAGEMAFLLMASDAAFDGLPARRVEPVDFLTLRPGDILRVKNGTYSVLILEKYEDHVTVVEVCADTHGYLRVHWGRTMSKAAAEKGDYVLTRYPD